jgi:Fur family zinc uptake transcriptional regulator
MATVADPFPSRAHDHGRCVGSALAQADEICRRQGLRLTELRRRVLELVWQSHAPIGAYRLMELLGQERGAVAPPTVYRALDFLGQHGLVHRIESLNAFVGCRRPAATHRAWFLICSECGRVAEFDDAELSEGLDRRVQAAGFVADGERIEIVGSCAECRSAVT